MANDFPKKKAISLDDFKKLIDATYSTVKLSKFSTNEHQVLKITGIPKVRSNATEVQVGNEKVKKVLKSFTFPVAFKYKDKKVPLFMRVGESAYNRFIVNDKIKPAIIKEIKEEEYSRENNDHVRIQDNDTNTLKYYEITGWNEENFIGKYAFFSKTSMLIKNAKGDPEEAYPQFINVISKEGFEPTEFKSALDTFNEIDKEENTNNNSSEPVDTSARVQEYVIEKYLATLNEYNAMAKEKGEPEKPVNIKDCIAGYLKNFHTQEFEQLVEAYKGATKGD